MVRVSAAVHQVVFVPGFMQGATAWAPVAERVGERYPSICLAHRSFSAEGRLDEISRSAGHGAALVGYSLGGRLCLRAALDEPSRFHALVLVGANAGIEDPDERLRRAEADEALAASFERDTMPAIVSRWERQAIFATQSPQLVAAQRAGRLAHAPSDLARLLRSAGQGSTEPMWDALALLETPLLAVAGALDERHATAATRMADTAPAGRAEIVPTAGHAPQLERPGEVASLIIGFLDSCSAR
ncbi:MAG: hypothetical protein NVSMB25_22060 [Thermoleophilaceae bacterium]